ncbi:MAG: hypothetical protein QM627_00290 [Luteolibacter sp.]
MEIQPCPWLPEISGVVDFNHTRRHGGVRGAEFYRDALVYAQSQWRTGKPAQAILQLNKAWMADLKGDEPVLWAFPPPYRALDWMLRRLAEGHPGFFGNPVRHFQHLASRVSGPHAEIRTWRAWVCFHLAERILPGCDRDGKQIVREGLRIPLLGEAVRGVERCGWKGELEEIWNIEH